MGTANDINNVNYKKDKGQLRLFSDANLCGNPYCNYCMTIKNNLKRESDSSLIEISLKSSTSHKIKTLRLILEEANGRFLNNYPNFKHQEDNPKPAA